MTLSTTADLPNRPLFTLGDRLRKARELTGADRVRFAATLGIHRQSVARYETEQAMPSLPVLRSWAAETGVDLEWLRGDEEWSRLSESNRRPSHYTLYGADWEWPAEAPKLKDAA